MSGALTLGSALAVGAAAAVGGSLLGKMMSKSQKMPDPVKPTPPPQEAQLPSQSAGRRGAGGSGGGGYGPGTAGTMLTGSLGIDSSLLELGKNSLLGQ